MTPLATRVSRVSRNSGANSLPVCVALLALTTLAAAQPPVSKQGKGGVGRAGSPDPEATMTSAPDIVKVVINPSRTSVSRDGSYGVYADIENVTIEPITLRAAETVLVVQPEVAQPYACVDWSYGIFPTQTRPNPKDPYSSDPKAEAVILPGEHYKVFWDLTGSSDTHGACSDSRWLHGFLGFVPGDYVFTVEGAAYTPGSKDAPVRHTFTDMTTLKVGISQIATAWAAFFGALLAYVVVSLQPGQDFDRWKPDLTRGGRAKTILVLLRNSLSAGLMGAAVTIVSSRLSDTQFPVKVSVNDFWGALTIGFVAYFLGSKFILTLATKLAPAPNPATSGPAAGPAAPPAPAPVTPGSPSLNPAGAGAAVAVPAMAMGESADSPAFGIDPAAAV